MTTHKFFSRVPLWILAVGVLVHVVNAAYLSLGQPEVLGGGRPLKTIAVGSQLLVAAIFLSAMWRRSSCPALEITDEWILTAFLFRMFFPRRRIALAEISELLPGSKNSIALRRHSGRIEKLSLIEIRHSERDDVRRAVRLALEGRKAS